MLVANSSGAVQGKFSVPSGIQAGDKRVVFLGVNGSMGSATFSGQGTLQRKLLQVETTITETRWSSPPNPIVSKDPTPTYDPTTVPETSVPTSKYSKGAEILRTMASRSDGVAPELASKMLSAATTLDGIVATGIYDPSDANPLMTGVHIQNADRILNTLMHGGVNAFVETVAYSTTALATDAEWQEVGFSKSPTNSCVTDPLAQTFSLSSSGQLAAVDIWFVAKGGNDVRVDVRAVKNGYPTTDIVASALVPVNSILTNGSATRINFDRPSTLFADTEYALVVLANDATTSVSIAELGKWDASSSQWVTSQPYTVGVLLSSSNATTWTAHQDRDMAFRLLMARYSSSSRTVGLGSVNVSGVTDLILMSYAEKPSSDAHVSYALTLPDLSTVTVSDGQSVRLSSAITGSVSVVATLHGSPDFSPILTPGTQLAYGTVATAADYITRAIPAGTAARVKVIFEAIIPSGASVAVSVKGIDSGDTWVAAAYQSSSQLGDGWMEVTHELASITETSVHVKLALAGNTNARPRVRNLRVIVL